MPFPIQLYYIALSQRIFDIYLYKLVEYSSAISNYLFIMNLLHKNILFSLYKLNNKCNEMVKVFEKQYNNFLFQ